jgi:hypothetical protein
MSVTIEQVMALVGRRVRVVFQGRCHNQPSPDHGATCGVLYFAVEEGTGPGGIVGVQLMLAPGPGVPPVTIRHGEAVAIEEVEP